MLSAIVRQIVERHVLDRAATITRTHIKPTNLTLLEQTSLVNTRAWLLDFCSLCHDPTVSDSESILINFVGSTAAAVAATAHI